MLSRVLVAVIFTVVILTNHSDICAKTSTVRGATPSGYAGSQSCRQCHEKFYALWANSRHGLAMQPYSAAFAKQNLRPQQQDIVVGQSRYRADLAKGVVDETGPEGTKQYKIEHVLGGKNVYYFLTPFPRGRLQTLPIAYDVHKKAWFDTAASGVRHFSGMAPGQPTHWQNPGYTFNTSCYSCHVSQLVTSYDIKTDTYTASWKEPGINCETCHGPSAEHNRVLLEAPKGQVPKDLKIIRVTQFTPEQHNSNCSVCHAKMSPITSEYQPGEHFFDHYDLVTLEDPDYYPDGRDLGENYTYTSWLMGPCVKASDINCVTCHTSSGRYRFRDTAKANDACLPCHEDRVKNAPQHTRHKAGSAGNNCIACHMPTTSFARMNRTDHSMRPPAPSATMAYNSPNACNLCHTDKDAAWADKHVREWRTRDYQAPLLHQAALVEAARKREWAQLPAMLAYIDSKDRDEVVATSLIRMLPTTGYAQVTAALLKAIKDASPLVRSAAADALQHFATIESAQALVAATGDQYRLVRVRAAASLARYPELKLSQQEKANVDAANKEYLAALAAWPDQWSSHFNLGNYYLNHKDFRQAIDSYALALKLEPQAIMPMVNQAMAYASLGDSEKAEATLAKALAVSPDNAAANFNMGLIKAEKKDSSAAEAYLKKALEADPQTAQAAYNLCILASADRINEALSYCKKAVELQPRNSKYVYTLAFFQQKNGADNAAIPILEDLIVNDPSYTNSYLLLGELYEKRGMKSEAEKTYQKAMLIDGGDAFKHGVLARLRALGRQQ